MKPVLAITMGDPAGIGPEVIAAAWAQPELLTLCRRIVVGRVAVMRRAAELRNLPLRVESASSPEDASDDPLRLPVLEVGDVGADRVPAGVVGAIAGTTAYQALTLAIDWALQRRVAALVTAPLNKESLRLAGLSFPGHTEILAQHCRAKQVAMMLYLPPGCRAVHGPVGLGVLHVTLHIALREVFERLNSDVILEHCQLAGDFTARLLASKGIARPPRIGVAALNPHAGENNLFGDEETRWIAPAVRAAQALGLAATGPLPCDTLMHRAAAGEFDTVVAMYHDQGHIALKLLGLHDAVNVTLGLPIVRTSVAHGTAFDIAWQGLADSRSMVQATAVALQLAATQTPSSSPVSPLPYPSSSENPTGI